MSVKFDFNTLETGFAADWPVIVGVPMDGGAIEEREFSARFRTLLKAEVDEAEAMTNADERMKWVIRTAFVGLGAGEEKSPLTPDELFETLWASAHVRLGLVRAYAKFSTGAPAKN